MKYDFHSLIFTKELHFKLNVNLKESTYIKSVSALTELRGFFGTLYKDASVLLKPQLCLRSHKFEIIFLVRLSIINEVGDELFAH